MLLLTAIGLTLPIYYFGMPAGNDLPQHYRFIYTFYDAVRSGDLYPSWPGETNLGFGDIGIRFYPPLAYYVVVLFRSLTDSWTTALAGAICFWFFVGGMGTYLLARESFSEKASLAGALIFMAMPYHVNQVYNAGLFAEFAGLAILPFCFLFVRRVILSGKMVDLAGLAISFALLILAHLPLVIIGGIGLAVYALALFSRENGRAGILKLGSGFAVALAMSSFYWVRMISELALVNHTLPQFTERKYDFHQNFLAGIFYMSPTEYAETSLWFTDILLAIALAMIVPTLIVLFLSRERIKRGTFIPFLSVLSVAILISTPLSIWLWEGIGLLGKIQFPWRFLGLISLSASVLIAGSMDELPALFRTKLRPAGLIAIGLIVAGFVFTAAQVIRPANYSSRPEFDKQFISYRSDESYECWWPVASRREALANRSKVSVDGRNVEIQRWIADERMIVLGAGVGTEVRIATFYYPFWKATVNGSDAEVERLDDGTIGVSIPPGAAGIRLYFEPPVYETASWYFSLTTWLVLLSFLIFTLAKKTRRGQLA